MEGAGETLVKVEGRYCGPPGAGNGGYVSGLLAERMGGSAQVTLRRATPLDRPIRLRRLADAAEPRWTLEDEQGVLAEACIARPELSVPEPPSLYEAQAASALPSTSPHPFPDCFVCGPRRTSGRGLDILPGPWGEHAVAAPWTPDASLSDASGAVAERFVWAALDCPGALAAMQVEPRAMVLGRITGTTLARVQPGEPCVVVGWRISREGRKHGTGTALFTGEGRLLGVTRQVWIQLEPRAQAA